MSVNKLPADDTPWAEARTPIKSAGLAGGRNSTHHAATAARPSNAPFSSNDPGGPGSPISENQSSPLPADAADGPFGTLLEPALRQICSDRLSEVTWFRTDWQRGGAVTGYATYRDDHNVDQPVVVKLPVPPRERRWLAALQDAGDVVPHLYAHGDAIGGYDLAWVIMERLAHGPLGSAWQGAEFDLVVEAVGRFYAASQQTLPHGQPRRVDWREVFEHARTSVHDNALAEPQRWNKALKKAHRHLDQWVKVWEQRAVDYWCHGDLHLANAMTRKPPPQGPAVLFDLAEVRIGHWAEDAVYFEHLYWARRERLHGRKLCKQIAHQRKKLGLPVDRNWSKLASVLRALTAMSTPSILRQDGNPEHVHAALEVLEREVR